MARLAAALATGACLAIGVPATLVATTGVDWAGGSGHSPGWIGKIASSLGGSSAAVANAARYSTAEVRRGNLVSTVSATGALAPVSTVLVGSQVSGQLKQLFADFNTVVSRGQLIAQIDPVSFQNAVDQAEADVMVAKATLLKATVSLEEAETELTRKQSLAASGSGSLVDRSKALALRNMARSQVEEAKGLVARAQAVVKQARTELERTAIRSPVDGVVIQRNVEAGQTMAASLQAPTLFTIAQDLRDMQVNASVDESEIGKIAPGQKVDFTVDAFPGPRFAGEVYQIRKSPQTTQNVVTYTVVVRAPNPDQVLLPGMTATARFIVSERSDVLIVPNTALRFKPQNAIASGINPRVWTLTEAGDVTSIALRTGLSDGSMTEVSGEGLAAGLKVVTGVAVEKRSAPSAKRLLGVR